MNQGFIYALINPSIPQAVKVGKTRRDPEDRAVELSAATCVATKFMVAYQDYFEDCDEAELYVHAALESKGYRISSNREFFNAPLNVVVRVISEAPGRIKSDGELIAGDAEEEIESTAFTPWADLLASADESYNGTEDVIQDYSKAIKLYKQAAKLGCVGANFLIGNMYSAGEGVAEDSDTALEYWRKGGEKDDWRCFGKMAIHFFLIYETANALKCSKKWFKGLVGDTNNFNEASKYSDAVVSFALQKVGAARVNLDIEDYFKEIQIINSELVSSAELASIASNLQMDLLLALGSLDDQALNQYRSLSEDFLGLIKNIHAQD